QLREPVQSRTRADRRRALARSARLSRSVPHRSRARTAGSCRARPLTALTHPVRSGYHRVLRSRLANFAFERGGLIALATLVLYVWLAPPHIVDGDNAEFATLGTLGGVAHPS